MLTYLISTYLILVGISFIRTPRSIMQVKLIIYFMNDIILKIQKKFHTKFLSDLGSVLVKKTIFLKISCDGNIFQFQ